MKKVIAAILCILLLISCCSCGKTTSKKKKKVYIIKKSDTSQSDDRNDDYDDDDYDYEYDDFDDWYEDDYSASYLKKVTASTIGKNYYIVMPKVEHPGVVGMDAKYDMVIYDKQGVEIPASELEIASNRKDITISGTTITVPYSVRSSSEKLTVSVRNKKYSNRTGIYIFNFEAFTELPTFYDDFNILDSMKWEYGEWENSVSEKAAVEQGNLVLRKLSPNEGPTYLCSIFKQSYGCFSAKILMPVNGLSSSVFALGTDDVYLKNKDKKSESGGQIDIVEYFPYWGNLYTAGLRWFGRSSFTKKAFNDEVFCDNLVGQYHIYSVVWTKKAIYWYVDGNLSWKYSGDGVSSNSSPMNIRLIMKSYDDDYYRGGPFVPNAFPMELRFDWIEVYGFSN